MITTERLSIAGCGTMGQSIAVNAALHGISVKISGIDAEDVKRAWQGISTKLNILVQHQFIDDRMQESIKSLITIFDSLEDAVKDASFVIEAAPEDIELKRKLFSQLEGLCSDKTILASNTSGLHPDKISEGMIAPERFVITHFWNPAHLIPLVEVAGAKRTSDGTMTRVKDLLEAMHKKVVLLKKPIAGFIGNRLQFALFREAQFLLDEGIASKDDIDAAVTYGIGRRLPVTGPLASADLGGLDVFSSICTYLFPVLSNAAEPSPALQKLVAEKKLGYKNGEGFYNWKEPGVQGIPEEREQELIRFLKSDSQM